MCVCALVVVAVQVLVCVLVMVSLASLSREPILAWSREQLFGSPSGTKTQVE